MIQFIIGAAVGVIADELYHNFFKSTKNTKEKMFPLDETKKQIIKKNITFEETANRFMYFDQHLMEELKVESKSELKESEEKYADYKKRFLKLTAPYGKVSKKVIYELEGNNAHTAVEVLDKAGRIK